MHTFTHGTTFQIVDKWRVCVLGGGGGRASDLLSLYYSNILCSVIDTGSA